ncbi:MAG: alpha/beta fold hydrolase [Nannocystis sp.]|nr:alpha/beta fold hydrolase [Nannocystis sp.]MBA3548875.1 alpha/beta fold hydrolase [Nannocystis sp.]
MRITLRPLASLSLLVVPVMLACRPAPMQPMAQPEPVIVEPAPAPAPAPALPETWVGTIELLGASLDVIARLEPDPDKPGTWRGRLDIPMQGLKDFPLQDVDLDADGLEFTLAPPGGSEAQRAVFVASREPGAATAQGELSQNGQNFPLKLRRLAPGETPDVGPKRPQEPKPPFPYAVREVSFTSEVDGVPLAGTLTAPADGTSKRHPAVVLLTGSGAQDRDESIMGHKPFLVLADHLTRNGIVVLRYDDRGVGGSGGDSSKTSHTTQQRDASAALTWLQSQPEVDPTRIGLIGHSEGANIGILTAAADKRVAFLVLLAGMGVSGKQIFPMQMAALLRAAGAAEDALPGLVKLQNKLIAALMKQAPRAQLEDLARELARGQLAQSKPPTPVTPEQLEALVKASLAAFETESLRSLLRHDPRPALRKLKTTPVLALNGSLDLQVPAAENLGEIEKALRAAKNKDVTIKQLPGLNHLFQHAKTGQVEEYSKIEETLAPELLNEVSSWIAAHTVAK